MGKVSHWEIDPLSCLHMGGSPWARRSSATALIEFLYLKEVKISRSLKYQAPDIKSVVLWLSIARVKIISFFSVNAEPLLSRDLISSMTISSTGKPKRAPSKKSFWAECSHFAWNSSSVKNKIILIFFVFCWLKYKKNSWRMQENIREYRENKKTDYSFLWGIARIIMLRNGENLSSEMLQPFLVHQYFLL